MRRGIAIVALLVVILGGMASGSARIERASGTASPRASSRCRSPRRTARTSRSSTWWRRGHPLFFPGFFLFSLFLFGAFLLIGGIFRGAGRWGRGGPHGRGPGPWNEEGRRRFEERAREWHQHEHGETPPAEVQPAG